MHAWFALQEFPRRCCTFNLHILNCRLFEEESQRGPVLNDAEYWIERALQQFKEMMRYRLSRNAEAMLARDWLDREALQLLANDTVGFHMSAMPDL